mgnify:CR=1 FL=1
MKIIQKNLSEKITNSDVCIVSEYPFNDHDLNIATAKITGRYPEAGFALNAISKEIVYVLDGEGYLLGPDESMVLSAGDAVFIDKNEKFAWDGSMDLAMVCPSSFDPAQHVIEHD